MLRENAVRKMISGRLTWATIACLTGIGALFVMFLNIVPRKLVTTSTLPIMAVGVGFALLLLFGLSSVMVRQQDRAGTVYRLALLTWWFVLICEALFDRTGETSQSSQGNFSSQAYGEGSMWLLAFAFIAIISLQYRRYLGELFTGGKKWVTLIALVCGLSVPLSPGKLYSAAWAFKLGLIVLMLHMACSVMDKLEDIVVFLKFTLWAFVILAILPTAMALSDPRTAFGGVGGRLDAGPDATTMTAAALMLMSVIMFSLEKKLIYVFTGLTGITVMLLCLGKTGNIAGILSAMLFLALQRKFFRSIGLLLAIVAVAAIIFSVTPLADHLESYQGASTLTGRTIIWQKGIEGIKQSPIWGHGYLASYFAFEETKGAKELQQHALNLHNGFLEVTYNNGLIGLFVLLMIHFWILRNVLKSMKMASALRDRSPGDQKINRAYLMAVGFLALYANLFLNGLLNVAFGGKPANSYMLFLALFFMSDCLFRRIEEMVQGSGSRARLWRAEWQPLSPLAE